MSILQIVFNKSFFYFNVESKATPNLTFLIMFFSTHVTIMISILLGTTMLYNTYRFSFQSSRKLTLNRFHTLKEHQNYDRHLFLCLSPTPPPPPPPPPPSPPHPSPQKKIGGNTISVLNCFFLKMNLHFRISN